MLQITASLSIYLRELSFQFVKSSGPGGQKVNKTNSCALLSWSIEKSRSLSEAQRVILFEKLKKRLDSQGKINLRSSRFRDRGRNIADCVEKFKLLLIKALEKNKKRVPTKPTRASKRVRSENKRKHSDKKRLRKKVDS